MKTTSVILLGALTAFGGCALQERESLSSDVSVDKLQQHIRYLASDELGGRKAGEEGNRLAAQYIAEEFAKDGLVPAGDSGTYFQNFSFVASTREGEHNALMATAGSTTLRYSMDADFRTLPASSDTSVTVPAVFAGYGISAPDSLHYDDYAGIDVKNKIVIVLRFGPEGAGENKFSTYSGIMTKVFTAREKGACGILFVTAPPDSEGASLTGFSVPLASSSGILAMAVKWTSMDSLFHGIGRDLGDLQRTITASHAPATFELPGVTISAQSEVIKVRATTANIAGLLPGSDPALKNQVLIIGAHMDHLGMGGEGSGSLKPDTVAVHHGADDNASGTAGLLEAAKVLSARRGMVKRSILFLSFSAEELGALGSEHYVKHPTVTLDSSIAMINMDMIGRMRDSTLVVEGMGTSPGFERLVKSENRDSLQLKLKPDGYGPSDHKSFYAKNIPVMFYFTNIHSDYHRPSDTWDKINYPGEREVVNLVLRVAEDMADDSARPAFTKAVASMPMGAAGDRQGVRVSLGIVPDFAEDSAGLRISGTRPGSPAEEAGLQANDIIIKYAGKTVKNIYDFTFLLGQGRPGEKVEIVVKRGEKEVTLTATLKARP